MCSKITASSFDSTSIAHSLNKTKRVKHFSFPKLDQSQYPGLLLQKTLGLQSGKGTKGLTEAKEAPADPSQLVMSHVLGAVNPAKVGVGEDILIRITIRLKTMFRKYGHSVLEVGGW